MLWIWHLQWQCWEALFLMTKSKRFVVKKETSVSKSFRLPEDLLDRMNNLAAEKNISLNKLVVLCCGFAMDNLAEEPEKANEPT